MSTHLPFANDFEHLEVFASVMAARTRKLLAQKEVRQQAQQDDGGEVPTVGRRKSAFSEEVEGRVQVWAAREERTCSPLRQAGFRSFCGRSTAGVRLRHRR